jgi:hypothetical protein
MLREARETKQRGARMTDEWRKLSDEELARIAQDGLQGQGAPVEAMRRLRVAMETSSRQMFWLTIVLVFLTLVQVVAAVPAIVALVKPWFNP